MDGLKLCCWCAEGETRAQFVASSRFPANQETALSDPRARGEGKDVSRRLRGRRGAVRFPGCVSPPGGYQGGGCGGAKKLMRKLGPRRGERGPWVRAAFGGGRKVAFFCFLASPERSHFGEGPTQQRLYSPYSCSFCPFFWGGGGLRDMPFNNF